MAKYPWGERGWFKIEDGRYSKRGPNGDIRVERVTVEVARLRHSSHPKHNFMWQDAHGGLWGTMREAMIASDGEGARR